MPKTLVTGGAGFLGSHVAHALADRGDELRLSVRATTKEENLAGLHLSVGALYMLDPGTYSLGVLVQQRRILGTDLEAQLSGNVIYSRARDEPEGSFGFFSYGHPLRHAEQRWAWGVGGYWRKEHARRYSDNGYTALYDSPSTPVQEYIPIAYDAEAYRACAVWTDS